jgi:hypothetical protein
LLDGRHRPLAQRAPQRDRSLCSGRRARFSSARLTITTRFRPSIIAQYPEAAQIDVWGEDPEAVAASSLAPREAARHVPGGWRLSGRYPFSSGCDDAQWAIIGAFLGEKGDARHIAYLLVPLAEVEIVDDWQVLGLLATGSKSLVLYDVFVPEHRSVMVSDLFAGTPPGALVHPDYFVERRESLFQFRNFIPE